MRTAEGVAGRAETIAAQLDRIVRELRYLHWVIAAGDMDVPDVLTTGANNVALARDVIAAQAER